MNLKGTLRRSPERGLGGVTDCVEGTSKGVRLGRLFRCLNIPVTTHANLLSTEHAGKRLSWQGRGRRRVYVVIVGVLLWLPATLVLADDCAVQHPDATVRVSQVIDGDTMRLTNRKLLRFMSINTPEIDHEHHTAEPMAEAARLALEKIIGPSRQIQVQYGRHKRYDRHGRLLAHVFTDKGVNVQQRLLQQGLGFWIAIPPNLALMACYHKAEQAARKARRGVWGLDFYRPHTMAQLRDKERGFRFITGVIVRVGESNHSIWLDLHDPGTPVAKKSRVALRISRDDLHYFKDTLFRQWQGRKITARGWLYPYKGQLIMRIKHPAALEWVK